jgi:hypothetical protein
MAFIVRIDKNAHGYRLEEQGGYASKRSAIRNMADAKRLENPPQRRTGSIYRRAVPGSTWRTHPLHAIKA